MYGGSVRLDQKIPLGAQEAGHEIHELHEILPWFIDFREIREIRGLPGLCQITVHSFKTEMLWVGVGGIVKVVAGSVCDDFGIARYAAGEHPEFRVILGPALHELQ